MRRICLIALTLVGLVAAERRRRRASLSIAPNHDGCAVACWRSIGRSRASPGRTYAGCARSTGHCRERSRRLGQCGHRPRRPRRAGWLHARAQQLFNARHQRRCLQSSVRCAKGFRTDLAACRPIVPDRRQESHAGEESAGAYRLAEGKSGQGRAGNRRAGRRAASCRPLVSETNRHTLRACPLSRHRRRDQRSGGRAIST